MVAFLDRFSPKQAQT